MFYYLYITTEPLTGRYYVGRHSTKKLDDGYQGSGRWVRAAKRKGRDLVTDIIEFVEDEETLLLKERQLISEHINNPLNMNMNENSVGFSSTNNPNKSPNRREEMSSRMKGENNPMFGKTHSAEFIQRMKSRTGVLHPSFGKPLSEEAKLKMSKAKKGIPLSDERRDQIREVRIKQYKEGKCTLPIVGPGELAPMFGKRHSEETKQLYSKQRQDQMFITDGLTNKRVHKDTPIPEGWWRGQKLKPRKV